MEGGPSHLAVMRNDLIRNDFPAAPRGFYAGDRDVWPEHKLPAIQTVRIKHLRGRIDHA